MSDESRNREIQSQGAAQEREQLQRAGARNVGTQEQFERKWKEAAREAERATNNNRRRK